MNDTPQGASVNCEWFQNELEALPPERIVGGTVERLLSALPPGARSHVAGCLDCEKALEDFAETRTMVELEMETLPEPGPWFTRRVMQAIAAKEEEIEERVNGFWAGVRRLAPRLVAFATLVLMIGGTWAFQEQRAHRQDGQDLRPAEGIFETLPNVPLNDDIIASVHERKQP